MQYQRLRDIGIFALAGVQMVYLASAVLVPFWREAGPLLARSAVDRSASILFGSEFAGYMEFLRRQVPENGTLVLPPEEGDEVLGHVGLMSYFLFPRSIVDCPSGEPVEPCIRELRGGSTYLLRVGDFPPAAAAEASKTFVPFDDNRGVYVPDVP